MPVIYKNIHEDSAALHKITKQNHENNWKNYA